MKKQKYSKPKIKTVKLKMRFFFNGERFLDSVNELWGTEVFAQYGDCLLPDTEVLMENGLYKKISLVNTGEKVSSYDFDTHKLTSSIVEKVFFHPQSPGGYLLINGRLKVTPNHPMGLPDGQWKKAGLLKPGDYLLGLNSEKVLIEKIEFIAGKYDVYNLEVKEKYHNYFADNILVHNKSISC